MRILKTVVIAFLVTACELGTEAETREHSNEFDVRATWNASAAGSSAVHGTVAITEYLGSHLDVTASLTGGLPNSAYQWRIFRGDCATNTPAPSNASPIGVQLFATIQSYPDLTTNANGTATVTRALAGALDSLNAYSLRVRVSQSATNWNGTNPIACGNLQRQ